MNKVIDHRIYSIEAVRAACMDIAESTAVKITLNESEILVTFTDLKESINLLEREFERLLLAHQTRIDIEARTKTIRELIIAQAFAPCDNIEEIVKQILSDEEQ